MTMNTWFQKKPTPKEAAMKAKRETKREVRSSQREMEREIRELDRQEKQITMELKARAKKVDSSKDTALAALAKQLVTVRQQRTKLQAAKAHLGAVGMHATSMASQVAAASALGSVTESMKVANTAMNVQETTKILHQFQAENERLEVKQEMMDEALIDAFDSEGVEEEADQVTQQVLAELGVELDSQMVGLQAKNPALPEQEVAIAEDTLPDLSARLNAL